MLKDPNNNFGHRHGNRIEYADILFRSSWEVEVVEWLDNHNIAWEYEPKAFKMENGHRYTPDFFYLLR